jgi:hypothetical protein
MTIELSARERLVAALTEAGAPLDMIQKAAAGHYGDFSSGLAFPITHLINDAMALGLTEIADRARRGDFDG